MSCQGHLLEIPACKKKWFGADELTIKEWRRKHLETGWKNYDIYSCTFGPPAAYVPVLILHLLIVCKAVNLQCSAV